MRSVTILLVTILFMSAAKADMNKWNKDQWKKWSKERNRNEEIDRRWREDRQDLFFPWYREDPEYWQFLKRRTNLRKNIRNEEVYYCKTWIYRCEDAIL
tara:strand:- start:172 stop:468 length:297 start_codon:yes stop_codon:yes gene_type:complete